MRNSICGNAAVALLKSSGFSFHAAVGMSVTWMVFVLAVPGSLLVPAVLNAEEPCLQFLNALRDERLFDVAEQYLDDMVSSPLASTEFRQRIPLYKVSVLLDQAVLSRDSRKVLEQLGRIEQILDGFIKSDPPTELLAEAQEQRARIFVTRATQQLTATNSDRLTAAEKAAKQQEAREYLNRADKAYEEIRQRLAEVLRADPDPQDPDAASQLRGLRDEYVKIRMHSPQIKEKLAESYGAGHPEYNRLLTVAANDYKELYEKYRIWPAGLLGCLGAGRCYEKLDEHDKALGYLEEILEIRRGDRRRSISIQRDAALVAIRCWESKDPYPLEEVYQRLRTIIFSLPTDFARTPPGIKLRLTFAKACVGLVDTIKADGGPGDPDTRSRMVLMEKEADNTLKGLVRLPGPHRTEAQALLTKMGSSLVAKPDEPKGPPTTMAEARQRGKDLRIRVGQLKSQIDVATDAATKAELRKQMEQSFDDALKMFELALAMTTDQSSEDDLASIRYLQCATYFALDLYFEASIIGEYLVDQYPTNNSTRLASELVCKSYWNMYRRAGQVAEGKKPDRDFERRKLKEIADLIFKSWPGSTQAEQAGLVMTVFAISEGDMVAAEKFLKAVPEDSPSRTTFELEIGNRLWRSYVIGKRRGNIPEQELIAIRNRAGELLENGVGLLKMESTNTYQARSALSLCELSLDAGETDKAIIQLESATVAPLDLVKNKHPAANTPEFRRDTFKVAIRAYLAKLRDGEDSLGWVEKSQAVLAALKQEIGETEQGKKQLSSILLTLAGQLKEQFDGLQDNNEREKFADGLESFLSGLGNVSDDTSLLLLTGRMSQEIGQGLRLYGLNGQAGRFFQQSQSVFEILKSKNVPDPRLQLEILRGLANSLGGTGQYERAIQQWGDILADKKNRSFLELQVEAARIYSAWGLKTNKRDVLVKAIRGGEPRDKAAGKNTIMGWLNLARAAQRSKRNSLFAESVYNMAQCRARLGSVINKSDYRQDAIDEIKAFRKNVPDMGGQTWKSKLEALLVSLQEGKG